LNACKIKSVLYVHATLVFTFLECLVEEKININILLAFVKTLTELRIDPEAAHNLPASLSVIGRFPLVSIPHWMQEKSG
jgi:hypothetical protein